MGFLKNLFGGKDKSSKPYVDKQGVYFYVQCDNCGTAVRLRADKTYDLINQGDGYEWHKTIVDNRCFRPIPTVAMLDSQYEIVSHEITGGHYITEEEYNRLLAEDKAKREQALQAAADETADSETP